MDVSNIALIVVLLGSCTFFALQKEIEFWAIVSNIHDAFIYGVQKRSCVVEANWEMYLCLTAKKNDNSN